MQQVVNMPSGGGEAAPAPEAAAPHAAVAGLNPVTCVPGAPAPAPALPPQAELPGPSPSQLTLSQCSLGQYLLSQPALGSQAAPLGSQPLGAATHAYSVLQVLDEWKLGNQRTRTPVGVPYMLCPRCRTTKPSAGQLGGPPTRAALHIHERQRIPLCQQNALITAQPVTLRAGPGGWRSRRGARSGGPGTVSRGIRARRSGVRDRCGGCCAQRFCARCRRGAGARGHQASGAGVARCTALRMQAAEAVQGGCYVIMHVQMPVTDMLDFTSAAMV